MKLLARDDYMVCSDITPIGSVCHPRSFGAYPRFLGRLRREFGGLTLEAMVARMTDVPARRFGLRNRGRIEPGYRADVTVFDADLVIDTATYDDPRQHPVGIPYVLVNGAIAVDGGVRRAPSQARPCPDGQARRGFGVPCYASRAVLGGELAVPCTCNPLQQG